MCRHREGVFIVSSYLNLLVEERALALAVNSEASAQVPELAGLYGTLAAVLHELKGCPSQVATRVLCAPETSSFLEDLRWLVATRSVTESRLAATDRIQQMADLIRLSAVLLAGGNWTLKFHAPASGRAIIPIIGLELRVASGSGDLTLSANGGELFVDEVTRVWTSGHEGVLTLGSFTFIAWPSLPGGPVVRPLSSWERLAPTVPRVFRNAPWRAVVADRDQWRQPWELVFSEAPCARHLVIVWGERRESLVGAGVIGAQPVPRSNKERVATIRAAVTSLRAPRTAEGANAENAGATKIEVSAGALASRLGGRRVRSEILNRSHAGDWFTAGCLALAACDDKMAADCFREAVDRRQFPVRARELYGISLRHLGYHTEAERILLEPYPEDERA